MAFGSRARIDVEGQGLSEIETWERHVEAIQGIRRITEDNIADLAARLITCRADDTYLTSPNYYLFTGRKGLWLFETDIGFAVFCWHPNLDGEIVVFCPTAGNREALLDELLSLLPMPPNGLILGRVPAAEVIACTNRRILGFERHPEPVLDWLYPVQILSTARVVERSGSQFMYIRNRYRQLEKHKVEIESFEPIRHIRAIESLLHRWSQHNAEDGTDYESLYAPYESLLTLSTNQDTGLRGIMIFVDDVLEAVGVWDISNGPVRTANLFVNLCNTAVKGLSEFLIIRACEVLAAEGIEHLNLGGSETAGLNTFKGKFVPDQNIPLVSIAVELETVETPAFLRTSHALTA